MKRTFYRVTSLLVIMVTLVVQAGAADLITETPVATEAVTELGLALADIPETISAEQTVDAEHVERLRDEEVDTNTAVFRNADGTNTLYVFSEDIWYYDEQGNKVDYTTEIDSTTAAEKLAGSAYKTTKGAGVLLLPGSVGALSPIQYSEGSLSISMYPTTDKIILTDNMQSPNAESQTNPAPYPNAEPPADNGGNSSSMPELSSKESQVEESPSTNEILPQSSESSASESASQSTPEIPPSPDSIETSSPAVPTSDISSSDEPQSIPALEDESDRSPVEYEFVTSNAAYMPVHPKAIASISSAEELQIIAAANAQASLDTGKLVNTAALMNADDAAVPDRQCVEYFRASRDASIVTTPLLHGVKNDIVLSSYSGNNTYSFVIELGSELTPAESLGDSIPLLDASGSLKAYINIEELRDANGNSSLQNRIDIAPYEQPGKYLVTVSLDEAFLTDPDTVYPLAASATSQITIGASYINDTYVHTLDSSSNNASSPTIWAGNANGGKYRTYFQFVIGSYKETIDPDEVVNAYLNLYEKSGFTSQFWLQPRIPGNIWSNSSLTWNNQPSLLASYNGVSAPASAPLTSTNTTYPISITTFIKACLRNYTDDSLPVTIHEQRGLAFKIENEATALVRYFNSTNNSSNKPTLTIVYNVPGPSVTGVTVSPNSATVSAGSTKQLSASVSPSGAPQGVSWSAGNTAIATVSSSGLVSALSPGTVTITAASTTDSSKKGTCIVSVNPVSTSYASVTAGNTYSFTLSAGQHRWYKFTPAESRAYTFTTTGSIDTYGELHQGTTVLTADDNSGDGSNFLITRPLTAGTQYFIKIRGASTSVSGNSVLSVSAAQISPTGVTVSPGSSSVSAGGTKQLSASVSPAGALQSVTWSSGNTAIATVSSSGLVFALSPGEVTITAAAAASSSVKGTATVTVAPSANSYAIISFGDNLYFDSSDSPLTAGQHRWYKFTPTETRRYVLTTSGTLDTVGELYQGETLLSSDDDGGAGSNFLIERDLTAGTEYRLKVKGANSSVSGSFSLKVDRLYSLTVKHYYDEGYVDRFSNASSQLSSYQNVCSSILYQLYGLQISSTTQNYHSVCDECKILQDMTRPFSESHLNWSCTHTENHLFADARMNDIISQFGTGSSTITRVSWTGHATPGQANFFRGDGLIHLLYMDWAEDYDYKRTYLHELSHSIGAQDHYCNGDENGGVCTTGQCFKHVLRLETRPICVMSCRRDNIETMGIDNVYCSYCDGPNGTIRTHLANHH